MKIFTDFGKTKYLEPKLKSKINEHAEIQVYDGEEIYFGVFSVDDGENEYRYIDLYAWFTS